MRLSSMNKREGKRSRIDKLVDVRGHTTANDDRDELVVLRTDEPSEQLPATKAV
jgi:hypothetical protein